MTYCGEQVDGLAVAVECAADVLRCVVLGALAAAPHDEGLGAELGTEVELAHRLAHREATHAAVVRGEAAVLEHGRAEQVGGHHRDDEAGVLEALLQAVDLLLSRRVIRAEVEEVVVVEGEAVGAHLLELLEHVNDVEVGAGRAAERVGAVVADGPESEGELVGGGWRQCHGELRWSEDVAEAINSYRSQHIRIIAALSKCNFAGDRAAERSLGL